MRIIAFTRLYRTTKHFESRDPLSGMTSHKKRGQKWTHIEPRRRHVTFAGAADKLIKQAYID